MFMVSVASRNPDSTGVDKFNYELTNFPSDLQVRLFEISSTPPRPAWVLGGVRISISILVEYYGICQPPYWLSSACFMFLFDFVNSTGDVRGVQISITLFCQVIPNIMRTKWDLSTA